MAISSSALPSTGFVRLPLILTIFPVSRSKWWAMVKAGQAPAPVKLSERTTAWRVADIQAFLASYDKAANDAGGVK